MESLVNIGIILSYVMVAFAALTAISFGVKKMMQNTNNAKKTLYTAGGLVVAFIIAYLLSSDEVLNSYEKYNTTASSSKQVGMGLITFYLLLFGAIVAILYAELSKVFSK
jgi:NADH:ubiquinone oxidoreductase subunit 6 (subunit J)